MTEKADIYKGLVTKELLLVNEHLRGLLENLSDGVVELSVGGRIVLVNRAVPQMWSCTKEEILGRRFESLSSGNHTEKILEWRKQEVGKSDGETLEIQETDPLIINGRVLTATFIPVHHSDSSCALCIFRDISRQYNAEKKKIEMDNAIKLVKKLEAMSAYGGGGGEPMTLITF